MTLVARNEPNEGALADQLLRQGVVGAPDLAQARQHQAQRNCSLGQALVELGLVPERVVATQLSGLLGLRIAGPNDYPDAPVFAETISAAYLRRYALLPLADGDVLSLAMADPLDDFAKQAIQLFARKAVKPLVGLYSEIEAALDRLYGGAAVEESAEEGEHQSPNDELETRRLMESSQEAPVIRYVNTLIGHAVESGASDIHCEPASNQLVVRIRIDGVLQEVEGPPPNLSAAVLSRIKILARLNIAERRLPQDGRIRMSVKGTSIDMRVSAIPTLHGERLVLRILDHSAGLWSLDHLGLAADTRQQLMTLLARPNGMVLVAGPTGSGKTTTIYAALRSLPADTKNIMTVEDPIEYQIAGIGQIQVKPQIGLTFANVLRSILRQDPDIVLVGEIRDAETAEIAVNAALTGHLVMSTLHTNTAAATIARLLDMGVPPFLLATALEGVLSQRLVRKLCEHCKVSDEQARAVLAAKAQVPSDARICRAVGCVHCRGTGYAGRLAIAELMIPTEALRGLMVQGAASHRIQETAIAAGMRPLWKDGMDKICAGLTTLDEVLQAVPAEG